MKHDDRLHDNAFKPTTSRREKIAGPIRAVDWPWRTGRFACSSYTSRKAGLGRNRGLRDMSSAWILRAWSDSTYLAITGELHSALRCMRPRMRSRMLLCGGSSRAGDAVG
jgi:hypothetical protein